MSRAWGIGWWRHTLREAGSRSMAMAHSEGGGLKINGGDVTTTKSGTRTAWGRGWQRHTLRLGLRQRRAPGPRMRRRHALGPGLRTAGGGGGVTVSRATEEQESARGWKIAKCGEREHGDQSTHACAHLRPALYRCTTAPSDPQIKAWNKCRCHS
jgi:hypothetical protein